MPFAKTLEDVRRSDPFLAGDEDVHISLEAYPWLRPHPQVDADTNDMHLVRDGSQVSLRRAIPKMLEDGGNDPEIAALLEAAGIENPSAPTTVYIANEAFTMFYKGGLWHGQGTLNRAKHHLTAPDRDQLLGKCAALARKSKRETIHELNDAQLREVGLMAQRNRDMAIVTYLKYALPESYAENHNAEEIVNDPKLADFLGEVSEYVWFQSRVDASDSEDWQDFKSQFCGNRPRTILLLDSAWEAFSDRQNRLVFTERPQETRGAAKQSDAFTGLEQLESLNDDEVNTLFAATKRAAVAARA